MSFLGSELCQIANAMLFKIFLVCFSSFTAAALNNGMFDNLQSFREVVEKGFILSPVSADRALRAPAMQQGLNFVRQAVAEAEKQRSSQNGHK